MTDTAAIHFNPLDPSLAIDPYPAYRELRETDPVHLSPLGVYLLTRHADVMEVVGDATRFEHQYLAQQQVRIGADVEDEPYFDYFRRMVFVLDNPDHRRIRKLLHRAFTPRRVRELHSQMVVIAESLIESSNGRSMDIISDFAFPLPMRVIGTLLGIPDADHDRIGADAAALNPVLEFLPMDEATLARANEAVETLAAYFRDMAELRRREPTDDLFSAMVHASEDGEVLSEQELIANAILLYVAGHETSAGGLGLMVLSLFRNPDQLDLLRKDPSSIPGAIEELLRYDAPGQGTARVLTQDTTFGDVTVPSGNMVLAYLGAANHDPAAFAEPDRLDINRSDVKSLAWGGGPHLCMGRILAVQELAVGLEVLLRRCPDLQLETLDPEFRANPLMRGIARLDARW